MKKYRYILWDLDGTIVNTYEGVEKSLGPAFEHYGIDWEGKEYYCFIGPPMSYSLTEYAHVPEEQLDDVIAMFRERYNTLGVYECSLFPGVREAFSAIRDAGYIQAIASSKPEERCRDILESYDLTEFLNYIVGASEDGRIDSKIEVLGEAFSRFREDDPDFSPKDVVLIGDTRHDAEGAREAGIDCIGVSYGYGGRDELTEHGVDLIYDDLASLVEDFLAAGPA